MSTCVSFIKHFRLSFLAGSKVKVILVKTDHSGWSWSFCCSFKAITTRGSSRPFSGQMSLMNEDLVRKSRVKTPYRSKCCINRVCFAVCNRNIRGIWRKVRWKRTKMIQMTFVILWGLKCLFLFCSFVVCHLLGLFLFFFLYWVLAVWSHFSGSYSSQQENDKGLQASLPSLTNWYQKETTFWQINNIFLYI